MPRLTLELPTELRLSVCGSRTDGGTERPERTATLGEESGYDRSTGVEARESPGEDGSALVRWHECWADD